ncbi:MAG: peptidyl-prolyl cis-trans isomerase [Cytophagales bacterium]|nr:peptidyl-prolyl cis-trans isomerase [Cytophagales bacterium]
MSRLIWLFFLIAFASCEFFQPKEDTNELPMARVNETNLYPSDMFGLIPKNLTSGDSLKFAEKFVDDWIKKQLMIARSQNEVDINEADIQRKVLDYRYALTRSAYEKKYIEENLDESVVESEIEEYYTEHSADFILKQNIVRCLFAQVSSEAPRLSDFKEDLERYPNIESENIIEYCTQFANKAFVEDSVWVDFDEVIAGTPLDQIIDKARILRTRSLLENSDENFTYYLRILEYKMVDEISPLEFVREDILNIIINKRKVSLKRELENKVYEDAAQSDAFEIYNY